MSDGTKDLIDELREYAGQRKGELAGMMLEAANRLEEMSEAVKERDRLRMTLKAIRDELEIANGAIEAWRRAKA